MSSRVARGLTAMLMVSAVSPAVAQGSPEIVVTATREQQEALAEIEPERSVDEDAVNSYGASSVGEVLAAIADEMGDAGEPVLFVNGVPITDPGDIVDYPPEAVERIDVLPRGAGARLGAATDKRAYNIVLKRSFKSYIGTARSQLATDGDWHSAGGEFNFSRISGMRRLSLNLRARDEDDLLEAERRLLQPEPRFPYALGGNVIAVSGASQIDPQLSLLAGSLVTVAGIPADIAQPSLSDFARQANQPNQTDLGLFRTLRPAQRNYEGTFNLTRPLSSWLSLSTAGRLDFNRYGSLQGVRSGLFAVPAGTPGSPFGQGVVIARFFADDPLESRSSYLRGNLGLALNATRGKWQITTRGDYRYSRFRTESQRQRESTAAPISFGVASATSPFAQDLGSFLTLYTDFSNSLNQDTGLQVSATGPVLNLPAGPLRANLNGSIRHVDQSGVTDNPFFPSRRNFDRDEQSAQGSIEVPLASREAKSFSALGDLSLTLDYGLTHVNDLGTIRRSGYALNWSPLKGVTLQGAINRQRLLPDAQQIAEAITVTEGVRYFDVVTGETIDVSQISGGNPDLLPETVMTRRLSLTAAAFPKINLLFNAEYLATRRTNSISSLPPTSVELLEAFPDRFVRAPDGRLVTVDVRPVNFSLRDSDQVRWGVNFTVPLSQLPPPGTPLPAGTPKPRLQMSISHTVNLRDEIVARPQFPVIDLLTGGAIGFGGGGTRHSFDASANLSDREVGIRAAATWRSASTLNVGLLTSPSQLRFDPILVASLRAFADLHQITQDNWLKKTRLSFNIANIFNQRQRVTDASGATPLRYQPGYRDPLGRTVEIELRKSF